MVELTEMQEIKKKKTAHNNIQIVPKLSCQCLSRHCIDAL